MIMTNVYTFFLGLGVWGMTHFIWPDMKDRHRLEVTVILTLLILIARSVWLRIMYP